MAPQQLPLDNSHPKGKTTTPTPKVKTTTPTSTTPTSHPVQEVFRKCSGSVRAAPYMVLNTFLKFMAPQQLPLDNSHPKGKPQPHICLEQVGEPAASPRGFSVRIMKEGGRAAFAAEKGFRESCMGISMGILFSTGILLRGSILSYHAPQTELVSKSWRYRKS
ncbi:hypothetical protein Ddc_03738 [Ditylenchus destructor]|nr:hypothetical protein Ddc_03738 [Ditylenchus destructor]